MTKQIIDTNIRETTLSGRIQNCLVSEKIMNVGQLLQMEASQLLKISNLGAKGIREVDSYLASLGYELKGREKLVKSKAKESRISLLIADAVKKEREKCADRAWMALINHQLPWNIRQDVTSAIMAESKE